MHLDKNNEDLTAHKGGYRTQKYISKNPISKLLVSNFLEEIKTNVNDCVIKTIHEIGCGEGQIIKEIYNNKFQIIGSDISMECINIAKEDLRNNNIKAQVFYADIYNLNYDDHSADLIICCEVLEHLENPKKALEAISLVAKKNIILSVPNEPIWRILNIMRLKYLTKLGNTPGHINHWTKKGFVDLVGRYFKIKKISSPLPWTVILCEPKNIK